jgi:hypothetical protein
MANRILAESKSLEDAFFLAHDARLVAEMREREKRASRKKALTEVSGITDDKVLDQLVEQDIHAETLAAFSLIPLIEVAWADGEIQKEERAVLLRAVREAGIPEGGIAFELMKEWLTRRPEPKLMTLWQGYAKALMGVLSADAGAKIRTTIMNHARAIGEAAGGFLGFGRTSPKEEKALQELEGAFIQ